MKTLKPNKKLANLLSTNLGTKFGMVLGMAALVFTGQVYAASTLLVGEHTLVTKIDGQEIQTGFFSDGAKKFSLPAGRHNITAKYKRLFDISRDDHDILRSVDLTLPVTLADGQTYTLDMINQPNKYAQAVDYAEKPTLALLHQGKVVVQQTAITGSSGGGLFGGIGKLFSGNTGSQGVVTVNTTAASTNAAPMPNTVVQTPVQQPAPKKAVLDSFMQIWLQATPAERAKIKNWVKDQ